MNDDPRRRIPSIDRLLESDPFRPLLARAPRGLVLTAATAVQDAVRAALNPIPTDPAWYAARVAEHLDALERPSLRSVINATGVVLHTNLGRAPLPRRAREAVERAGRLYSNLEYDLEAGGRGSRYDHCAELLKELTGAEAALVVNNNAAAVLLALNTLALDRDAVVSRGELVEIGGSFRVPEIMARSGARMVEVGSTNRTHPRDYERVLSPETGAVLAVHRSNFQLEGFTSTVSPAELATLAHARGVPVINDLGSGLLLDPAELGLPAEPTAGDALRAGVDVVTMSGDKLLGGPQAGIVLGRAERIERMRDNPLCRALRVDKLTLAALEATLAIYRDPERARREVPALRMLTMSAEEIGERADGLIERLLGEGIGAARLRGHSVPGGGATPGTELETVLVAINELNVPASELSARLRLGEPPVVARIVDDRVVLDPRTVFPEQDDTLARAIACSIAAASGATRGAAGGAVERTADGAAERTADGAAERTADGAVDGAIDGAGR